MGGALLLKPLLKPSTAGAAAAVSPAGTLYPICDRDAMPPAGAWSNPARQLTSLQHTCSGTVASGNVQATTQSAQTLEHAYSLLFTECRGAASEPPLGGLRWQAQHLLYQNLRPEARRLRLGAGLPEASFSLCLEDLRSSLSLSLSLSLWLLSLHVMQHAQHHQPLLLVLPVARHCRGFLAETVRWKAKWAVTRGPARLAPGP